MNNDLIQKLAISKKIMEASDKIKPGQSQVGLPITENINATYNIPQEMLSENIQTSQQTKMTEVPTTDRIRNSKLPDEIKRLMMEHPIQQPSFGSGAPVLSNEIIEGAARLMGRDTNTKTQTQTQPQRQNVLENNDLKQMIRDVVRDTVRDVVREELQNAGMLTEGTTNTNESLQLRVGKHIFEGKVTKIKKVK